MLFDGDTFEHEGHRFRVTFPADDMQSPPWELHDGHGPVSDWTTRAKRPGEIVLAADRSSHRFYDFAEAILIAKRDGWDAPPFGEGTKGQRAVRAVLADIKYLRGWVNDEWTFVGVVVELLNADGDGTGKRQSVWGIESDASDYLEETARELASELLYDTAKAQRDLAATLGVVMVGQRWRLKHAVDVENFAIGDAGDVGTIVQSPESGLVYLRMDRDFGAFLSDWDNCFCFGPDEGRSIDDYAELVG